VPLAVVRACLDAAYGKHVMHEMTEVLGAPHKKPAGWRVLEGGEADGMRNGHTLWEHSDLRRIADESLRWTRIVSKRRGTYRKRPKRQDFTFWVPRDADTVVNTVSDSESDESEEESDEEEQSDSDAEEGTATPRKRIKKEKSQLSNAEEEEFRQLARKAESARERQRATTKKKPAASEERAGGGGKAAGGKGGKGGLISMTPNDALDMYAQLTGGVAEDDTHLRFGSPARPNLVKRPPAKQSMYMSDELQRAGYQMTPEMNAALMQVSLLTETPARLAGP